MRIALAQMNPIVGDLDGNVARILHLAHKAHDQGADLAVFPELCVVGYPPMDLLENDDFIKATGLAVERIMREAPASMGLVLGAPMRNPRPIGKRLFNAALLLEQGRVVAEVHKTLLPTYDVFDEYRYFEPGQEGTPVLWRGRRLGIHICEDMWNNEEQVPYHLYDANPVDELAAAGIDLFINISASPFSVGKVAVRDRLVSGICREHGIPFVLVNQVGANTEIIFDGGSGGWSSEGVCVHAAPCFRESLTIWDLNEPAEAVSLEGDPVGDLHDALVLGIRDYFEKTGTFSQVLIGLSGGIDSAVTCALAVNALGPDRVVGMTMPSRYSSAGSVSDSVALADALGIVLHRVPIESAVAAFESLLEPIFGGSAPGVAEENIQARSRGLLLMAVSNKFDHLLLTTGNKSEMAVGYATLYGDMNGGVAVLADVFKTDVYELAEYINRRAGRDVIPRSTIDKPPSAELRPGQTDQDSLPPYPVLDAILRLYVEDLYDLEEIVARTGFDPILVRELLNKVDRNEYKRRQAAPGLRVSGKAFGIGRRLPIVMRWMRGPDGSDLHRSQS